MRFLNEVGAHLLHLLQIDPTLVGSLAHHHFLTHVHLIVLRG